ncbi:transposase [Methylococcaceae bacterium WWC4]|nr:transposase [Methylococcaceae bacterium WWC4]
MDLWKMMEVSGLSHSALPTTMRNFPQAETLHAANDAISNVTAALPVFQEYDIHHQKHSSSDGQPIVTQIDSALQQVFRAKVRRKRHYLDHEWELDDFYRSLHILDFIDDAILRQRIQKALNRGEAYHRMRREISYVNACKFRVKTETEQQIWNECSLLIANANIHYDTLILSRVYEQKLVAGDRDTIEIIKGKLPVAWQIVNLIGKFEFTEESANVDIEALAARYNAPDFWRKSVDGDSDL